MSATWNETQSTAPIVLIGDQAGITVIPPDTPLQRLNYFEGKFLRADDLQAEQEYVRSLAEQTAKAGGAGIAYGFDTTQAGDALLIGPGLAFDAEGRPLLLSHDVRIEIPRLIAESRRVLRMSSSQAATAAGSAVFDDCIIAEDAPPSAVVQPGTTCWRISISHADAYCGVEDVYGRLCEDACITQADRPYRVEGIVIRATPFPVPATPHGVVALNSTHLRSLVASAAFAAEAAAQGSLISRSGLALSTWCLGAAADARPDVSLALVVRHGDAPGFLDTWSVRRERIEPPARRYWAGRMAMRPLDVFLAQVLQFQCQLHEGPGGGVLQAADPCAPHLRILAEASGYLAQIQQLAGAATNRLVLAGGVAQLDDLRHRIETLATAAPAASTRILIDRGIVELPSAGYLPVQPGPSPTVNDQVRALFGEGVDARICIVRPDFVPHALEEAQHMERISLLHGLDHPAEKPLVDVLVPEGEKVEITTRPPGRGFVGGVRIVPGAPPATAVRPLLASRALDVTALESISIRPGIIRQPPRDSAVAVNGAGRGEGEDSGALSFHFAGAAPVPAALDVAALAHALAGAGSSDPTRIGLIRGLTLSQLEIADVAPAFFTRMTTLAADALRARSDLLASQPVFEVAPAIPPVVFKPPVPQHEAAVVNLWLSLRCDRNPLTLRAGESTAMQLEAVLAMPSEKPSLLSYRIFGTFSSAQPRLTRGLLSTSLLERGIVGPLGTQPYSRGIRGRFSGVASVAATIDGTQHDARSGDLELDVAVTQDLALAGAPQSMSVSFARPNDGRWLATARWGGSPLHVEVETSQQNGDQTLRLASAALDENDDVLLPGNAAHTVALSALEVIGVSLGDPDWADAHGELLFPAAPPPPDELIVRATRDWVLFHRRRDKDCGGHPAAEPAVARRYQLFHVSVPDAAGAERFRRALLQNDAATIAAFRPTAVDQVEFAGGLGSLRTNPDALGIDWQNVQPGRILQYGALASSGAGDGLALAQSRLARLEEILSLVSPPAPDLVNETVPYVAAPLAVPDVDGAIVLVTRTVPTTCQSVYRLKPENATEAVALAGRGDIATLLGDRFVTAVADSEFDAASGELVSDRTALQNQWQAAGGGTPSGVVTISKKGDTDAGAQGARLDRAASVATALGATSDLQRNAIEIAGDLPAAVHCPVVTLILPTQRTSTARVTAMSLPPAGVFTRGPLPIELQSSLVSFAADSLQTGTPQWAQLLGQLQSIAQHSQLTGLALGSTPAMTAGAQQRLASFTAALAAAQPPVALVAGAAGQVQQLTAAQQALLTSGGTTADELITLAFLPVPVATECQSVYLAQNADVALSVGKTIAASSTGGAAALARLVKLGDVQFAAGGDQISGDTSAARTAWGGGVPTRAVLVVPAADRDVATRRAQAVLGDFSAGAADMTIDVTPATGSLPVACGSILILAPPAAAPTTARTARILLVAPSGGTGMTVAAGNLGGIRSVATGADLVVTFENDVLKQDAAWTAAVQAIGAVAGGSPVQRVLLITDPADASATAREGSLVDALAAASPPLTASTTVQATQQLTDAMRPALTVGGVTVDETFVVQIVPDADTVLSLREVATAKQLETALKLYQDAATAPGADQLTPEVAAVAFQPSTAQPGSGGAADTVASSWALVSDKPPQRLVLLMPDTLDAAHADLHRARAKFVAEALGGVGVDEQNAAATDIDAHQAVLLAQRAPKDTSRLVRIVALVSPSPQPGTPAALPKQFALPNPDLWYTDADLRAAPERDALLKALLERAASAQIAGVAYEWRGAAGDAKAEHDAAERGRGFLADLFAGSRDVATSPPGFSVVQLDAGTIAAYLTGTHAQDVVVVSLIEG